MLTGACFQRPALEDDLQTTQSRPGLLIFKFVIAQVCLFLETQNNSETEIGRVKCHRPGNIFQC